MNKPWLLFILCTSFLLLSTLKKAEVCALVPYFKSERIIKLRHFKEAQSKVGQQDKDLLKLWESMLTGRSAPLAKWMKERYQRLGLSHLFTPSGFHISAVLFPFMKIIPGKFHLFLILFLGLGVSFLPGMGALKRMLLIKGHQKVLGLHLGFILALLLDMFWGSFQNGALSFTYSFLFIGIIYSRARGLSLIVWIFLGQILIAYFQNADVSPLLLIFSPILNFAFGISMPLLFILAFPLWHWQLWPGLFILKCLQTIVDSMAQVSMTLPQLEVHMGLLILIVLCLRRKKSFILAGLLLLSSSLNLDRSRTPSLPSNETALQGKILRVVYTEKEIRVLRSDGNCRMKLVRGFWWENCSPKRGSRVKKLKKLSYPS